MIDQAVALAEEIEIEYLKTIETRSNGEVVKKLTHIKALAVAAVSLQSEIGNALALESARRGRDAVGVVYHRDGKTKMWAVSLRSCDIVTNEVEYPKTIDFRPRTVYAPDVSVIAKSFGGGGGGGGGGHAKAAGFEVEFLPWTVTNEIDSLRNLVAKLRPAMLNMLSQSGPWLECPFCGSPVNDEDDTADENDDRQWHTKTCLLRDVK